MTFYLDGVVVGSFQQFAIGSAGFDYHVPVYANTAVTPGPHTFTVQNGRQGGSNSLMILDSIVYSYDDGKPGGSSAGAPSAAVSSVPASAKHSPSGATLAVAVVLIFTLVLMLAVLAVFLYHRRRSRREVYARYMPNGSVQAFPSFLTPSIVSSPALTPLPPAYAGGSGGGGGPSNWWTGRDQKSREGTRGIGPHRPYVDLDPSQAGLQRPQQWEHTPV
jgi:hypothetical protein